jgi:hypothetical protein
VIDAVRDDDMPHRSSQHGQNVQQRRRIRSTRTSDKHHVATDKQFVITYRPFHKTTKRRRMRSTITPGQICTRQTLF